MKKIYDAVERFCARHPRFGIPNLMRYIVIGNVVVYILSMLSRNADATALDFLAFNLNGLLHGEVWRLVTFVFVPEYSSPFALIISVYTSDAPCSLHKTRYGRSVTPAIGARIRLPSRETLPITKSFINILLPLITYIICLFFGTFIMHIFKSK